MAIQATGSDMLNGFAANSTKALEGDWCGEGLLFGHRLHFAIHVAVHTGKLRATFDCVEPGFYAVPIQSVSLAFEQVCFDVGVLGVQFQGALDHRNGTLSGVLMQGSFAMPLTLRLVQAAEIAPAPWMAAQAAFC